jgi:hypothetical protein
MLDRRKCMGNYYAANTTRRTWHWLEEVDKGEGEAFPGKRQGFARQNRGVTYNFGISGRGGGGRRNKGSTTWDVEGGSTLERRKCLGRKWASES